MARKISDSTIHESTIHYVINFPCKTHAQLNQIHKAAFTIYDKIMKSTEQLNKILYSCASWALNTVKVNQLLEALNINKECIHDRAINILETPDYTQVMVVGAEAIQ